MGLQPYHGKTLPFSDGSSSITCYLLGYCAKKKKKLREERRTLSFKGLVFFFCFFPFFRGGGGGGGGWFNSRIIWVNGSISRIRAETERFDIVRFSKVTTKPLASGLGNRHLGVKRIRWEQNCRWTLTWCENKTKVVRPPCESTSGNLNKTTV